MTKLTLNDVFNQWLNNKGLLKYLTENFNVAWKGSVDGSVLDLEYHGNRSGTKIVAPLLLKLVDENGISDENAILLSNLLFVKFGTNWSKLWNTLELEYDPISNYDMEEREEYAKETGKTIEGEDSREDSIESDGSSTDQIVGFNSSSFGDSGKTITETDTSNTSGGSFSNSEDGTEEGERVLTRKGNIGTLTTQQMVESERRLWTWKFFEQVFEDIDSVVVLKVFGKDHGGMNDFVINVGYRLPTASETTLGGVKVGENLSIDEDGVLSASDSYVLPVASESVLGGVKIGENLSIDEDGTLSASESYVLPVASESVLGGVKIGNNLSIDENGTLSASGSVPIITNKINDETKMWLSHTCYIDHSGGLTRLNANQSNQNTVFINVSEYTGKRMNIRISGTNNPASTKYLNRMRLGFFDYYPTAEQRQNDNVSDIAGTGTKRFIYRWTSDSTISAFYFSNCVNVPDASYYEGATLCSSFYDIEIPAGANSLCLYVRYNDLLTLDDIKLFIEIY